MTVHLAEAGVAFTSCDCVILENIVITSNPSLVTCGECKLIIHKYLLNESSLLTRFIAVVAVMTMALIVLMFLLSQEL
jgi:hypothetical protein